MDPEPQRRSRRRRLLVGSAFAISTVAVAGYFLFRAGHRALDSGLLADLASEAVLRATDGRYRLSLDSLRVDLDEPGVSLFGGRLSWSDSSTTLARTRFDADFQSAHLGAVDLWEVARGRLPTSGYVVLEQAVVHIHVAGADSATAGPESPDVLADIGRRLHALRLDSLILRRLTVSLTLEHENWTDTLSQIDLALLDISVDSTQSPFERGFVYGREARLYVAPHARISGDSLYTLSLGAIRGNSSDAVLRLDSLRYAPNYGDVELNRIRGHRAGRYRIETGPLVASGIDLLAFVERRRFVTRRLTVDRPRLDYYNDLRWPPGPRRHKVLPHRKIRTLGSIFAIDTLHVRQGHVVYRRFVRDGARRASLPFTGFAVSAYNLTNDPSRMAPDTPAVVHAEARLGGAARLATTIRWNLMDEGFNLTCDGSLGRMGLDPLNDMLVNSEGLMIKEGTVERIAFDIEVRNGHATGSFDAHYRDLSISEVDKRSGDTNLRDRIRAFLLNRVVLRSNNLPEEGKQPRVGRIDHRYTPDETFLRFLWLSVRSGIFSVTGMDRIVSSTHSPDPHAGEPAPSLAAPPTPPDRARVRVPRLHE